MRIRTQRLPIGYREVEYIESTGTQYINTNVTVSNNISTELDIYFNPANNDNKRFISYEQNSGTVGFDTYFEHGAIIYRAGSTINNNKITYIVSDPIRCTVKHILAAGYHSAYINSQLLDSLIYDGLNYSNLPMYLFARNNGSSAAAFGEFRLYNCKIQKDNSLIRDFIPCIRTSDNKPGLYDTVNDVFYVNQGTGEFIKGPYNDSYQFPTIIEEGTTNLFTVATSTNARLPVAGNGVDVQTTSGDAYCLLSLSSSLVSGSVYTLSFDVSNMGENDTCSFGFYDGGMHNTTAIHNGRTSITFTAWSNASGLTFDDGSRSNANVIHLRNFQLEQKDHATPYVVGTRPDNAIVSGNSRILYAEGTTNLGNTSATYSNKTHGQTINCQAWGGDAGTCTFYRSGGFMNYPYKVYHKTATGNGGIYTKTADDIVIEAGKTYTMSVYVKASRSFTASEYSFNINRGSNNNYINFGTAFNITTQWKRIARTFTATSSQAGNYGEMSIIYDDGVTDYYVYYSGFQIEQKDHATLYTPDTRPDNTIL